MIRPHNATATAVIVLGDDETVRRCEQLTARAALRSTTVVAMFGSRRARLPRTTT